MLQTRLTGSAATQTVLQDDAPARWRLDTVYTIGAFEYDRQVDPVTDSVRNLLTVWGTSLGTGDRDLMLGWHCEPDSLAVTVLAPANIAHWLNDPGKEKTVGSRLIQYRFDRKKAVGPEAWTYHGTRIGRQWELGTLTASTDQAARLTRSAPGAKVLLYRIFGHNRSVVTTARFDMTGAREALAHIPCAK